MNRTVVVGRIVRYVPLDGNGSTWPAVVNEVAADGSGGVVGLMVVCSREPVFHALADGGVPYDASGSRPGTWHWPSDDQVPAVMFAGPDQDAGVAL
ncbi:hypothetical protein AB0O47_40175 [Streptomyces noursei]|uniref:hypothetical protein n=1 Tax=Streptomyces noursei TaxID=1971 RepID=UPI00344ED20B